MGEHTEQHEPLARPTQQILGRRQSHEVLSVPPGNGRRREVFISQYNLPNNVEPISKKLSPRGWRTGERGFTAGPTVLYR